jgi:alkanesulfonate monooxygenase
MEAKGLGFDFPPLKQRFEQLEDALKIAKAMWAGDESPFIGKYIHMERPLNSPQPLSKPHPPILIGGGGEKKTLRLVARYADACNLFAALGPEGLRHKLDLIKQYCDETGRDYNEIEKTALGTYQGAPANEFIETCKKLSQTGIQHFIVNMPNIATLKPLEILGKEVIPAVSEF